MAKYVAFPGSQEARGAASSYIDAAGAYMDYDAGGNYAQFGGKGAGSIGVKIRNVIAGVATTLLTFGVTGLASFAFAMSAPGITSTSGLTVSSGTSVLQGVTATTLVTSGVAVFGAGTTRVADFNGNSDSEINLYAPTGAGGVDHRRWGIYNNGTSLVFRRINDAYSVGTILITISDGSVLFGSAISGVSATMTNTSANASLALNGGATANLGSLVSFSRNGTISGYVGNDSAINGGNGNSVTLYGQNGIFIDTATGQTVTIRVNGTALHTFSGTTASLQAITGTTLVLSSTLQTSGNVGLGDAPDGSYRLYVKSAAVLKFHNVDDGFTLAQGNINDWRLNQIVVNSIFRFGVDTIGLDGVAELTVAATARSGTTIGLGGSTQTTIGANGAASALTANPLGYLVAYKGATKIIIPYYNA